MNIKTAGIAGILIVVAALGWYLGSPLFIRTTLVEPPPVVAAAQTTASPRAAGTAAPAAPAASAASTGAPAAAAPATIATGDLGYVDPIHNGTGRVLLLRSGDGAALRFENVAITNAPDVHVYLSRETGGKWTESTSLYLGPLKATNGSFNYAIPPGTDLSGYKSVVVWCRQFAVLVTWADLH